MDRRQGTIKTGGGGGTPATRRIGSKPALYTWTDVPRWPGGAGWTSCRRTTLASSPSASRTRTCNTRQHSRPNPMSTGRFDLVCPPTCTYEARQRGWTPAGVRRIVRVCELPKSRKSPTGALCYRTGATHVSEHRMHWRVFTCTRKAGRADYAPEYRVSAAPHAKTQGKSRSRRDAARNSARARQGRPI